MKYLKDTHPEATIRVSPPRRPGYGANREGYGRKIATEYVVRYGNRDRRVYYCVFSNIGTAYVLDRGEWQVVSPWTNSHGELLPF
jgi:hypothetical protein